MQPVIYSLQDAWSRGELLTLVGVLIAAFAGLLTAASVTVNLWGWTLRAWLTEKRLLRHFGADLYLPEEIKDATRYYVRPDATSIDLAQEMEEGSNVIATRENLFKAVDRFLDEESPHRHLLLLADSGMGKSSFMLNYYDYNRRKICKRHKLAVIPLGADAALEKIKDIKNQNETILFLDAFDEDPEARKGYEKRLDELIKVCTEFRRVLITCRTQFFPKDTAIPKIARMIFAPRRGQAQHTFWRLYLAPFSDKQVNTYLRRRFKPWAFKEKRKAFELAAKVPKLTVRPMLLLHIPDLLQAEKPVTTSWEIYQILTEKWYERELGFWKDTESIRKFSEEIAVQFYINFLRNGSDRVSQETIASIIEQQRLSSQKIDDPLKEIANWNATVRSLLHRDAVGNWKFAHRSIMEFLFLKKFFADDKRCHSVPWTSMMKKFIVERSGPNLHQQFLSLSSFSGADLSEVDLGGVDLRGMNFGSTAIRITNLSGVNFSKAILNAAIFCKTNLSKAILSEASLRQADLTEADLRGADLSRSSLSGANLRGANLRGADLCGAHLNKSDLRGADLSRSNLRGADLSKSNLNGAIFRGADLSKAILSGATLRGANFHGAIFSEAELSGIDLTQADLSETDFSDTDIRRVRVRPQQLLVVTVNENTIVTPAIAEVLGRVKRISTNYE
ncbi:MAG: pentapeptide repeat-containing protein [Pyrinomonadaceae bacterium]